mmetsp:Transcript_14138/g.30715  ORF Transcript_14138/g.30715 Transcript_14138/m.30715 type:complete len:712 (+) Transcript_14138:732-2867(+)|eukprot:CAMPEP_0172304096 /NCGR_PEP_ID=MMETSP1058-20130122/5540_1 /TAXON_ID=83371 /ORGANISM="Detonula confervacea, Strain CCMP 353" /LENGTH=711 /DNA_ID=CAMNT_0013015177 /DNA_START=709 /DNA_END=2844 /DNA_ORIENTATION=+
MAMTNSEWDDIPTSSELFGGDFFGDELMEMYTADHGLNLGDNSASVITTSSASATAAAATATDDDAHKHPGVLVAMNAMAMDGGLSPLGTAPEFAPISGPSDTSLPLYPTQPAAAINPIPIHAAAPAPPVAVAAPVPMIVSSAPLALATAAVAAKRPPAAVIAPQGPSKKFKVGAVAVQPLAVASIQVKIATSGGVKVAIPPVALAARPDGRVFSASNVAQVAKAPVAPAGIRLPSAALLNKPAFTAIKSTVIPKAKMPVGGGINHQVFARPSVVPSSAAVVTSYRPASSLTSAARVTTGVIGIGGKKPEVLPTSSTGVKRAHTEADFKDVASAAVSSLIQNASTTIKTIPKPAVTKLGDKTVDVSTAHINALTSQNWVTACNPIPTPDLSSTTSSAAACDKAARNARRATLTQEERAKQNRDRNREHARNTRLRKKAYVEELKRTLTELVAQRDAADLEKRHEAQRNREQREVRFRVMEEFLKLRGRNESNAARWVAILEDGFTFTLPRTPYRHMVDGEKLSSSDVNGNISSYSSLEQVLRGASTVMEDSTYLSTFLQSIGGPASSANPVQVTYRCDRKRFFMDSNVAFMDFTANTVGAVAKGAANEVVFMGSMKSSFSPASNKLISVSVTFDTASIIQQVEAMGDHAMSNTTDAAAAAAHEADALLDSLQMPQIFVDQKDVAAAVAGPVSVSSDDGELSTDGSSALLNA